MSWLDGGETDLPSGLAEWAAAYPTPAAARAACPRADWLLWLLLAATDSEKIRRFILHAAAFAVEHSPALRAGADSVAPVHIWGSPSPPVRPIRPFRARLLLAAAVATLFVAVVDVALYAFVFARLAPSSRQWAHSATILVMWGTSFRVLDAWFDRRADRALDERVRAMTFPDARAIVMAALARSPEDSRALKAMRDANAQWFQTMGTITT